MSASKPGVQPLMYGYMRVVSDASDDELDDIEQQMRRFAAVEGFSYATTFYECQNGSQAAFNELAEELKRAEAHHVVVPSMSHISAHPILLAHMVERLEMDAAALVVELGDLPDSTAAMVIEGGVVDGGGSGRTALTAGTDEQADHPGPAGDD